MINIFKTLIYLKYNDLSATQNKCRGFLIKFILSVFLQTEVCADQKERFERWFAAQPQTFYWRHVVLHKGTEIYHFNIQQYLINFNQ